jgi:pentose-5-phosphate-3-epimerase
MDGQFAPTHSPDLNHIWWPQQLSADIHLMYQFPMNQLEKIKELKPHLAIIHAEAQAHHMLFASTLHSEGIKAGLAILQDTPVDKIARVMHSFDHILVFSGNLGHHGGLADLTLIDKVKQIREHHPDVEIGWDGGINDKNVLSLVRAGVEILNVGGYIQEAGDPKHAYDKLKKLIYRL